MPTTLEQDEIFNEAAQEAYYQSYLPIWRKIWEAIIDNPAKADNFINYLWEKYFDKRQIPTMESVEIISKTEDLQNLKYLPEKTSQDAIDEIIEYIMEKAERFNLNSMIEQRDFVKQKLQHLFNSSDAKYYKKIYNDVPNLVEKAVAATDDIKRNLNDATNIKNWEKNALKALKRLMIFAFLREDSTVLKILIRSEINKVIYQRNPTTRNSSNSKTRKKKK